MTRLPVLVVPGTATRMLRSLHETATSVPASDALPDRPNPLPATVTVWPTPTVRGSTEATANATSIGAAGSASTVN